MRDVIFNRLQSFGQPGSMGVVTNTRYAFCFWPHLNKPTMLFAAGSKGLEVMGSARNVIFPDDTVFLDYYPDALYPAELAVQAGSSGISRKMLNLSDAESAVWRKAYDAAVAEFPPTHVTHATRDDVHRIWRKALIPTIKKPSYNHYITPLSKAEAIAVAKGEADSASFEDREVKV